MATYKIAQLVLNLVIQGVLALAVWNHYKNRVYPASEKYSTFGPRFWTGTVDSCVLWPVRFAASLLLVVDLHVGLAAMLFVAPTFVWFIYTVVMHARYGQTYGKRVCKVRVVDNQTEEAISFRQALLRESIPLALSCCLLANVVHEMFRGAPVSDVTGRALSSSNVPWLFMSLPALWFMAEAATMLSNSKRRALHDYIAGTVVVRTNTE